MRRQLCHTENLGQESAHCNGVRVDGHTGVYVRCRRGRWCGRRS